MRCYRLVSVAPLPSIDASSTVMDAIVPKVLIPFVRHTMCHQWRRGILVLYVLVLATLAAFPFLPLPTTSDLSTTLHIVWTIVHWVPLLALPYCLMVILEARVELLQLLFHTYEFWFLQVTILMFLACLMAIVNERTQRLAFLLIIHIVCAIASMLDTVQYKSFHEVLLPVWTVVAIGPLLATLFLNAITATSDVEVVRTSPNHALTAREICLNCLITIAIFSVRSTWLYYRARTRFMQYQTALVVQKVASLKHAVSHSSRRVAIGLRHSTTATTKEELLHGPGAIKNPRRRRRVAHNRNNAYVHIQSISYRVRIRWEDKVPPPDQQSQARYLQHTQTSPRSNTGSNNLPNRPPEERLAVLGGRKQMWLIQDRLANTFHASQVMSERVLVFVLSRSPRALAIASHAAVWLSWMLVISSFPLVLYYPQSWFTVVTTTLALVMTLWTIGLFVGLYHPRVLRRLGWSFDVLFLSFQLTMALLCVSDVMYWDPNACCLLLAIWCWAHWLLTLDALLPEVRNLLSFQANHHQYIPLLLTLLVVSQVYLSLEVLVFQYLKLQDRLLFQIQLNETQSAAFGVVSCMMARFATLIPWCLRLLWRHFNRDSNQELLLLRGSVEYIGHIPTLKPKVHIPHARRPSVWRVIQEKWHGQGHRYVVPERVAVASQPNRTAGHDDGALS